MNLENEYMKNEMRFILRSEKIKQHEKIDWILELGFTEEDLKEEGYEIHRYGNFRFLVQCVEI